MKIEEFISANRDALDRATLPLGHHERMMNRIATRGRRWRWRMAPVWICAAVAACIICALFVMKPEREFIPDVCDMEIEVAELDAYYRMQREQSLDSIEILLADTDPALRYEMRTQLKKIDRMSADTLPRLLLAIDADQYLALTVRKNEIQNENLELLINILKR